MAETIGATSPFSGLPGEFLCRLTNLRSGVVALVKPAVGHGSLYKDLVLIFLAHHRVKL